MANYMLKDLVPMLSRALKDVGKMKREDNCGTGNGTKTTFRTNHYPVRVGSLTAYVNGVAASVNSYDYVYGTFTLSSAPTLGQAVTSDYIYYGYPSGLLQDYVADGVIRAEALVYNQGFVVAWDGNGDAYLTSEPDQATKMLYVLQATINVAEACIADDNLVSSRSFKDEEIEQSYMISAQLTRAYLESLRAERDKIAETLMADDSDYGYYFETQLNTDEAKYRYLESIRAAGGFEAVG
jgi:hypothetical protein